MTDIKITVRAHGSYKVEPGIPLFDEEGNRIPTPEGRVYSLCRCGLSKNKPFCDGAHREGSWDPTLAQHG
ncbi:MAG: CDGSH iron-sulfur domain-containing protein [Gemmatimonadetes bacterium]|nr:CDGSH iron-sulfur domain-containing protein [Gemmatimonadota bacterium]